MTKEERHRQIGRVVEEHQAAKTYYACLRAKASEVARDLKLIATYLENDELDVHERSGKLLFIGNHDERFISHHSDKAIATLIRELNEAEEQLTKCEEQRQSLGIS